MSTAPLFGQRDHCNERAGSGIPLAPGQGWECGRGVIRWEWLERLAERTAQGAALRQCSFAELGGAR